MGWLWTSAKDIPTVKPPSQSTTQPESFDPPPSAPRDPTPTESTPFSNLSGSTDVERRATPESVQTAEPAPRSTPSLRRSRHVADQPPSSFDIITPTTTLPSTLACRSTFDAAFYCQSFGGQFVNIYRYGSLRDCREHWSDFWFCVRTNRSFMNEEQKAETIRAWALNKEREKYGKLGGGSREGGVGDELDKSSSEDVWEARRWKVREAFAGDWGILERDAREKADLEMQREVR